MLLSFWFFCASLSSVIHLYPELPLLNSVGLSDPERRKTVALVTRRVGDVVGSCAIFITTIQYILLSPEYGFWDSLVHMTNSFFMIIEYCLNNITSHVRNIMIAYWFMYVYLIFTWIIVPGAGAKDWPYWFLDTDSAACFGWYPGLLVIYSIFFVIWKFLFGNIKGGYYEADGKLSGQGVEVTEVDNIMSNA